MLGLVIRIEYSVSKLEQLAYVFVLLPIWNMAFISLDPLLHWDLDKI